MVGRWNEIPLLERLDVAFEVLLSKAFELRKAKQRRPFQQQPHGFSLRCVPCAAAMLYPDVGLHVILRNAEALRVENAKAVLGPGVALLGGFEIPVPGRDVILRNAVALGVENAKGCIGPRRHPVLRL